MVKILKKDTAVSLFVRVVIVLAYGLAGIVASLNHSCGIAGNSRCRVCSGYSEVEGRKLSRQTPYNQNNSDTNDHSDNPCCAGCMHLVISKSVESPSPSFPVSIDSAVSLYVRPQNYFAQKLVWVSSAPLRAPPILTS